MTVKKGQAETATGLPDTVATPAEAPDARHQAVLDLISELQELKPRAPSPTFEEFAPRFLEEHCWANRHKARGIKSYASILSNHLLPRFGERQLSEISQRDIQGLKAALAKLSPKTVNNILSVLSSMLTQAVAWEVLDKRPVRIKLLKYNPPELEFYEWDEYDRLTVAARTVGLRQYVLTLLGGDAGNRSSEARALEWRDVDFRRNQLVIQRADSQGHVSSPKGGRTRRVPMTDELARALRQLRDLAPKAKAKSRVLLRDDGSHVSEQTARTWMAHVEKAAGFRRAGNRKLAGLDGALHILRHTYCSHLAMLGVPLTTIQKLAGHQSARTTEKYVHLGPTDGARAVGLLDRARTKGD